jgi:hypothetical protein
MRTCSLLRGRHCLYLGDRSADDQGLVPLTDNWDELKSRSRNNRP